MVVFLGIMDLSIIYYKGINFDMIGYSIILTSSVGIILLGLFYRQIRCEENIANTLIMTAGFILFTMVASVFNYMLLPLYFPRIDDFWIQFDGFLGYHWPSLVAYFSDHPASSRLLKLVYFSSMPQLILMVLLLGLSGHSQRLAHFFITGISAAALSIAIWAFFPTFGTSVAWDIPPDVASKAGLAVTPFYAAELIRLSKEGVDYLSPSNILGLIGFPSFHAVMAAMAVVFSWSIKKIRLLMLILNILMIPALLLHGGHHLSDLFGGIIVFVFSYFVSGYTIGIFRSDDNASDSAGCIDL